MCNYLLIEQQSTSALAGTTEHQILLRRKPGASYKQITAANVAKITA